MSIPLIRQAILLRMQSVPQIGRVFDFEPYAAQQAALQAMYGFTPQGAAQQQIRGWFVTRPATSETSPSLSRRVVDIDWMMRGYMSFNNAGASALVFEDLIEALRDAFRTDETLGGTVATTVLPGSAGLQLEVSGPVMFAGVLCHGAELSLMTRHYL